MLLLLLPTNTVIMVILFIDINTIIYPFDTTCPDNTIIIL